MIPLMIGKRVVKFSQAMGPFNKTINRTCAKFVLPRLDFIVARGEKTKENLDSLGLSNVKLGSDLGFALEIDKGSLIKARNIFRKMDFKQKLVGICPSSVIEKNCNGLDYAELTADFIDYVIENDNFDVLILPHSIRKGTGKTWKKKNNDLPICREIYKKVKNKKNCRLVLADLNSEELRYLIGKCDYFVASRFHSMVSSLAMKVPTMVIGWSHKYLEVLKMFDVQRYCIDYKELTTDVMIDEFGQLREDNKKVKSNLSKNLKNVIVSSKEPFELVKNLLES